MERSTVGSIATHLQKQQSDNTHSPHEQMLEQLSEYDKNIYACVASNKKTFPGDFFLVVLTKKEKLLENVLRNYFYARLSCPTPDYDQTVYRYDKAADMLQFVWVIPSRHACFYLKDHALDIPPEERQLLDFVMAFADGTLYKLAKKFNGEKDDSIIIEGT